MADLAGTKDRKILKKERKETSPKPSKTQKTRSQASEKTNIDGKTQCCAI